MVGDWTETTLGDVLELKRGYDLPSSRRQPGAVPIISSSGVTGTHNVAMCRGPGVITGRYGTIGQVFYVAEDYWPLNTTLYVKDFKGANPRFVSYFLTQLDYVAYTDKAAVPGINRNDLHRANVAWPTVKEQEAIADVLSTLDDKIELNRRMVRTSEELAQALFRSWFVDFDPVRAKAEGRATGLSQKLADLFPSRLSDDGLPEGWRTAPITDLIEVNPSTPLRAGTVAPYVDMAALPTSGPTISTFISRAVSSGSRFQNGDTLVARITPCLENGKTGLVDFLAESEVGWGSTEFIVLRPRNTTGAAFPYLLARHEPFRAHLIGAMTGSSGRQRVPTDAVSAWEMALPTSDVVATFAANVEPLFERMRTASSEAAALATMRDALLPKLISGELRIKDAGKAAAA